MFSENSGLQAMNSQAFKLDKDIQNSEKRNRQDHQGDHHVTPKILDLTKFVKTRFIYSLIQEYNSTDIFFLKFLNYSTF